METRIVSLSESFESMMNGLDLLWHDILKTRYTMTEWPKLLKNQTINPNS